MEAQKVYQKEKFLKISHFQTTRVLFTSYFQYPHNYFIRICGRFLVIRSNLLVRRNSKSFIGPLHKTGHSSENSTFSIAHYFYYVESNLWNSFIFPTEIRINHLISFSNTMKSFKLVFAISVHLFSPEMSMAAKSNLRKTIEDDVDTAHQLQKNLDPTGQHSSTGDRNLRVANGDNMFWIENKSRNFKTEPQSMEVASTKGTNFFFHEGMYTISLQIKEHPLLCVI